MSIASRPRPGSSGTTAGFLQHAGQSSENRQCERYADRCGLRESVAPSDVRADRRGHHDRRRFAVHAIHRGFAGLDDDHTWAAGRPSDDSRSPSVSTAVVAESLRRNMTRLPALIVAATAAAVTAIVAIDPTG
jgi:hypothetical protein